MDKSAHEFMSLEGSEKQIKLCFTDGVIPCEGDQLALIVSKMQKSGDDVYLSLSLRVIK